jgi:hypothetical protein
LAAMPKRMALVTPGAFPSSMSIWRIDLRNVSALIPNRPEIAVIAARVRQVPGVPADLPDRLGLGARVVPAAWHRAIILPAEGGA